MFKTGRSYKYNGKVIEPTDDGWVCSFDFYDEKYHLRQRVTLTVRTVPAMIRLIDTY